MQKRTGAIAWMAANPVASNLAMLVLLLGGLFFVGKIRQEVTPEFDLDQIRIVVPYPGASPSEVESGIVIAVEESIRGLDGIDKVTSSAKEGSAVITADLTLGTKADKALTDIQQAVGRLTSLPQDSERPQITSLTRRTKVLDLIVHGKTDAESLRRCAEDLRLRLLKTGVMTQIDLVAVPTREISIEIEENLLRKHNLSLDGVAQTIRNSALDLPGGSLRTTAGEILVRTTERRNMGMEFGSIPLLLSSGNPVLLRDVATIRDTFAESSVETTFNGEPSAILNVWRVGMQRPLEIADKVKEILETTEIPKGITGSISDDASEIFTSRIDLLVFNAWTGFLLVIVFLALFLEPRLAFWVTMSIPISFLGAFWFLPLFGVTINMVSLFAFIMALGIVVDDAIVIGENCHQYRHTQKLEPLEAAQGGTADVAMPVTFSILTNIVTFLPLAFIPGFMGKFFYAIPVVVCITFAISLIDSLYLMPARLGNKPGWMSTFFTKLLLLPFWALAGTRGMEGIVRRQAALSEYLSQKLVDGYTAILIPLIRHRIATILGMIMLLVISVACLKSGYIKIIEGMPRVEADKSVVNLRLKVGVDIEQTRQARALLEKAAAEVASENEKDPKKPLLRFMISEIGRDGSGSHILRVQAVLWPPEIRPINTSDFTAKWEAKIKKIPGAQSMQFISDSGGPGSGSAIQILLSHADSKALDQAAKDLAEELPTLAAGVCDIDDGRTPGKRQFDLTVKPQALALGLDASSIGRQLRNAFYGSEALRQQRSRDEVRAYVRFPKDDREHLESLEKFMVRTPSGAFVPLHEVATLTDGVSPTSIERTDGARTLIVSCDVKPLEGMALVLQAINSEGGLRERFLKEHPGLSMQFTGRQEDTRKSMDAMKSGFLLSSLGIFVLLAVPLRSFMQPLFIMTAIPFGIVGAIWAHVLMGYPMSLMSWMGIVALGGVAVNASLLMLIFTEEMLKEGVTPYEAVVNAGKRRIRPIMLSTLTCFLGLVPMIFETSRQAKYLIPMAISLGFGVLFASCISLIFVPCLYLVSDDLKKWFHGKQK